MDAIGDGGLAGAAAKVTSFYEGSPFPGYAAEDDAASLLARGHRNPFIAALDRAIPTDATVLDCGCGTGQIAAILALRARKRTVVGADASAAQLRDAEAFRNRVGIPNLHLVRADLFALPLPSASFDWVISRGVVHHTDEPYVAIRRIARHVAPGGHFVVGYYDGVARIPHRLRRALSRVTRRPVRFLDPILRRSDLDEEKKRNWIQDQYFHPVEKLLSLGQVAASLRGAGVEWVRTVPPFPASGDVAEAMPAPGLLERGALRLGWMLGRIGDADAGLVCVIGRRQLRS